MPIAITHRLTPTHCSLEQAYVNIRAPVGNGWDFKVGKFVTILGYEVIERPANMNITYGQLWQNAFPSDLRIGVLSSYRFDDYLGCETRSGQRIEYSDK